MRYHGGYKDAKIGEKWLWRGAWFPSLYLSTSGRFPVSVCRSLKRVLNHLEETGCLWSAVVVDIARFYGRCKSLKICFRIEKCSLLPELKRYTWVPTIQMSWYIMSSLAQRGSFDFDERLPEIHLLEFENLTDLWFCLAFLIVFLKQLLSPWRGRK